MTPAIFTRALRLPFTTASALPFIFGSLFAPGPLAQPVFWLGLVAVVAAHLGANLINDYADSRSGADWGDKRSYNFFGGSKLIQEGVLSEKWYLIFATLFSLVSAFAIILAGLVLGTPVVLYAAAFAILLSWAYSTKPLALSYRRLGELVIFVLFGPVPVMGGYYLQTGVFPDLASFLVSLPFGFLTAAILYANEIPDYDTDRAAGKHNLANSLPREKSYIGYVALSLLGLASVVLAVSLGLLSAWALLALVALLLISKAARVLKNHPADKLRLIESAKLSIGVQTLAGLILIGTVLL